MNESEYEYAFGQWVVYNEGNKCRFLGYRGSDNKGAVIHDPNESYTDIFGTESIRPDPNPPELVAGQLVMVRDGENEAWKGPYKYIGKRIGKPPYPHVIQVGGYAYAKPYIPNPVEPALTDAKLQDARAELAELKDRIEKLSGLLA